MTISHLTFTRFLAAFIVFIFHFAINSKKQVYPFCVPNFARFFKQGDLAVVFFFVLSGFVLSVVYFSPNNTLINLRKFYVSRIARIYPVYLLSIVLYILIGYASNNSVSKLTWVLNFFLLQSWFPDRTINLAAWSLSVEIFFYILFPVILWLLNRYSVYILIVYFVISWSVYFLVRIFLKNSLLFIPPPLIYLPTFILGIIIGLIYKKIDHPLTSFHFKSITISWTLYCTILLSLLVVIDVVKFGATIRNDQFLILLYALIIITFAWDKSWLSKILSKKMFLIFGNLSYCFYILQFPLKYWFDYFLLKRIQVNSYIVINNDDSLYFYTFFLFCLCFSVFIFYSFEEPMRKSIRKLLVQI